MQQGNAWLIELRFYVALDKKYLISEMFFRADLLAKYWKTKIQQGKHAFIS